MHEENFHISYLICLYILVAARRFLGMGAADSRSLRFGNYVCMQHFVRRTKLFP
jgi:hypothetical protein